MATYQPTEKIKRPTQPRIPLVDLAAMTAEQRGIAGIGASAVIRTLIHREDLMTPWVALGGTLLSGGQLSARDRELVILRVALRTNCDYEWANHAPGALAAGATEQEILAVTDESANWPPADAALFRAADEICTDNCVSDETWSSLRVTRSDGEVIELLFVIGYYLMNAGILNALGVQSEPGRPHLATLPTPAVAPQTPTPEKINAAAAAESKPVDGSWHITFYHPAGAQQLTLDIETKGGRISGSVKNAASGMASPITDATVEGDRISYTTMLSQPIRTTITWCGTTQGDFISGEATVAGAGTFTFAGTRA